MNPHSRLSVIPAEPGTQTREPGPGCGNAEAGVGIRSCVNTQRKM